MLHGVQLWVALPEATRQAAPAFEHHPQLPVTRIGDFMTSVFMGELAGACSDATAFSPLVGAELTALGAAAGPARCVLPLDPAFEHVVFVVAKPGRSGRRQPGTRPAALLCRRAASGPASAAPAGSRVIASAAHRWASNC